MHVYITNGRSVERLPLTKPYSAEARAFIRGFYHTYRCTTTIAHMAREVGVPESSFRRIVRRDEAADNKQGTLF